MRKKLMLAALMVSAFTYAAPVCISSNPYDYNSLGSEGCSLGDLTFTNFSYVPVGIGSIQNAFISSNGIDRLVLSGLVVGDFGESNGMSLSFDIDGLSHPFSRKVTFVGSCTHDPSEGAPNNGLRLDLGGHPETSPCDGNDEIFTITEWFGPSPNYPEYGRFAVELAGYSLSALYSVTVEYSFAEVPEPATLLFSGAGLAVLLMVRRQKKQAE